MSVCYLIIEYGGGGGRETWADTTTVMLCKHSLEATGATYLGQEKTATTSKLSPSLSFSQLGSCAN